MKRSLLASVMILLFSASLSLAAESPCQKDRKAFCEKVRPGAGRIMKCLRDNSDKVSQACKDHVKARIEKWANAKDECHDDLDKFCGDVEPGQGRLFNCLKKHKKDLSPECKGLVTKGGDAVRK